MRAVGQLHARCETPRLAVPRRHRQRTALPSSGVLRPQSAELSGSFTTVEDSESNVMSCTTSSSTPPLLLPPPGCFDSTPAI
ncbi:hypothetical protein NESM_000920100 [Novymonas esmeraldas]|uniref:Uncharacterized protein n=1 Tax=Novymonas esmeraldas TaxID=1808958 RepID=A0AAW0EZ84_9TRYP